MMTESRGSSNAKAKHELEWRPTWPSWRDGFVRGPASLADKAGTGGVTAIDDTLYASCAR